jgi:hypothetical protein
MRSQDQLLEKHPVHIIRIMLPRMQDEIIQSPFLAFPYHRGHFDDFGARAEDY